MKKDLNDRYLKSLAAPESGRLEVSDIKRSGLRFRLSASGKATWMFEKRVKGGQKRKHTFGAWPEPISLSTARAMALEIEAEAARGFDRIEVARAEKAISDETKAKALTVIEVIHIYDQLHLSTLRRGKERKTQLVTALKDSLDTSIGDLRRSDFQRAVDDKAQEGLKVHANRIRAALLAFGRWAWQRSYIETDIGAGIPKAAKEVARDRLLGLDEVREIWTASFQMGNLWGPAIRLLLLTAQRRGEILGLRKSEVNMNAYRIEKPGSRTKNSKPHITHLSHPALAEVEALIAAHDAKPERPSTDYLFTTTGKGPISGVSKAKARLDKILGVGFEPWTFHDIRTAFSTAMVEANVPESIADRILNHAASSSASSTVARTYNLAEQLPQRGVALDRWAELVSQKNAKIMRIG